MSTTTDGGRWYAYAIDGEGNATAVPCRSRQDAQLEAERLKTDYRNKRAGRSLSKMTRNAMQVALSLTSGCNSVAFRGE